MRNKAIRLFAAGLVIFICVICSLSSAGSGQESKKKPALVIPRTWDDEAMRSLEVPLASAAASPKHIPSDYYYRIPVRPVHRSYPVYHPRKEPRDYADWLKKQEPQIIFDSSRLKTEQDWIKAGEMVFDASIEFVSEGPLFSGVRDTAWYEQNQVPTTRDDVFPFMRYVIREKGKIEVGILSCAMCHTRVMRDGSLIKGAQGNFPDDRSFAYETRMEAARAVDKDKSLRELREFMRRSYAAPWLEDDLNSQPDRMTIDEIASVLETIPPGVCARQGSSAFFPPRIPDLIGVRDRLYLDSTGLVRHRTVADLMRYAALNQGGDVLSLYGSFRPRGELPDPSTGSRYSDEQLYALALYIYSLKPPANPNRFNSLAARGKKIFEREGCEACHTPPLYTNNMLVPADGFKVPDEHHQRYEILAVPVGTDTKLTLKTRRGTGYYKVPSLKGVWYRGPFEHNGSVATLEDWFDPNRVKDDYVPTGFRGHRVKTRAVTGHLFGMDLSIPDRKALIAFLKTL